MIEKTHDEWMAAVYGGGGHKGSAGFKLPIDKLKDLLEGKL